MVEMFDKQKANLSGLLEFEEHLHVSDVIHKAFIEVNEDGTEAAAATSGKYYFHIKNDTMRKKLIIILQIAVIDFRIDDDESNDFPTFRADHPFLYYIWDTESKTVIFIGHLTK